MINSITFNQDNSCISLATDTYHKIFNVEPFGEIYNDEEPTEFMKILFSTSLTIIIPKLKDNRVLKIYNLKQKLKICELIFPGTIIDVKINKKRLIVVLKVGQIYIYDLSCVKLIKIIEITKLQEFIGDLSNDDKSLLVVPLNIISDEADIFNNINYESLVKAGKPNEIPQSKHGWVLVYDTINLKPKLILKCHSSDIQKIIISNMVLVTASVKGTIIRAFHLNSITKASGNGPEETEINLFKIQNLRRGRNPVKINSLCLNNDSSILGCGSQSSTIHFFRLDEEVSQLQEQEQDDLEDEDVEEEDPEVSDEDGGASSKSSEDLNENLANLLISKPQDQDHDDEKDQHFLSMLNNSIFNSTYTKKIIKKLPYKEYLNNFILEPPKRSFSYIKLKGKRNKVTMGFSDDLILIVTSNGDYYQYKFSDNKECKLVNKFRLT